MSSTTRHSNATSTYIPILLSTISVFVSVVALYSSYQRDVLVDRKGSTRDWQKGAIFATLLSSSQPLAIEDIETRYRTTASAFRDRYGLTDPSFSREEVYSVILDLVAGQSIKLRDNKFFALRTDDDSIQDRRVAFEMLEFVLVHEFHYGYDEFASQFSNWYSEHKLGAMTKDRSLAILAIAMQSNVIGMGVKPGFRISCIGEVPALFVASAFSLRSNAPAILPMPAQLAPCAPK